MLLRLRRHAPSVRWFPAVAGKPARQARPGSARLSRWLRLPGPARSGKRGQSMSEQTFIVVESNRPRRESYRSIREKAQQLLAGRKPPQGGIPMERVVRD
jgi:hypothetical protein